MSPALHSYPLLSIFLATTLFSGQTLAEYPTAEELMEASPLVAQALERREVVDGDNYSPYNEKIPQRVFWGDTHLHSAMSVDANSAGNENLTPAQAYQFARGDLVTANSGQQVRLNTPLDFLVVADHAEYLGLLTKIRAADPILQQHPTGKKILAKIAQGSQQAALAIADLGIAFIQSDNRYPSGDLSFDTWKNSARIADQYNDPGNFTTLIGYEWTYFPGGDNLHRVVVYKDGAEKAASIPPFSALDGQTPEQLWDFMQDYEEKTGGEILAIPHNSNVSNGTMFAVTDSNGAPFSEDYSQRRQRWEPLVEVTQIKGDSEAHPFLSPDDEFADFETWDQGNLNPFGSKPKHKQMLQYEYARSALKLGLEQQAINGSNPFKFGMIGSTDAHTSLATAAENNFWGKASAAEPGYERSSGIFFRSAQDASLHTMSWQMVASGYAAVWAEENNRESLFSAMQRKEVYATTGSRIVLRFFGGWDYQADDIFRPDVAHIGYRKGVPMGGDLPPVSDNSSDNDKVPTFLVTALKDSNGANLDRIQIVKGWLDRHGKLHEKVYNVAASSERKIRRDGSLKAVASTVDLKTLRYKNTVGQPQLATVWKDPDFDPVERAFYYARVLEIPTPRWTEYDRKKYGFNSPDEAPKIIQDRAYSSPIWYRPKTVESKPN